MKFGVQPKAGPPPEPYRGIVRAMTPSSPVLATMVACLKAELALAHTFAMEARHQPDRASYLRREAERVIENVVHVLRGISLERTDLKAIDASLVHVRTALALAPCGPEGQPQTGPRP